MTAPAAPIPNDPPRRTKGEGPIGRMVNLGGVFGAATLMVIAIARVAAERVDDPPLRFEPAIVREELAKGNPAAYAAMACVMLAITPPLGSSSSPYTWRSRNATASRSWASLS